MLKKSKRSFLKQNTIKNAYFLTILHTRIAYTTKDSAHF